MEALSTTSETMPPPAPGEGGTWPREFGRYVLLSPLAQGGMGDVCLALAGELAVAQRLCVVKTVRPEYARDQEFLTRFMDEGRVLCALSHPNIGQILEVGMENGTPFVAMEHVAGIDLDALLYTARAARSHLPMDFVFILTAAVLDGMSFAHRATALDGTPLQLVHRDISPQNVRMSWEGDVKVLDFGTAHATGRSMQTAHGLVFGKPGYMSPEQARGEKVDARSDLFAIGVVMWELLTDKDFAGAEPADHMEALAAGSYSFVPPTRMRRDAPRELDEWFETITAWNAEQRFADAATARRRLVDIGTARGIRFEREAVARTLARYFPTDREQENARIRKLVAAAKAVRANSSNPPAMNNRAATAPLQVTDVDIVRGTRYRIGERIGSGGMGEVFAAEHVDLGRKVALKVLYAERSNDPAVVQRFRLEARSIAKLKHPNLVEVYDLGNTEDGRLFYAMERLVGETLRERMSHGDTPGEHRVSARECVRIGTAVARGLAVAHNEGVVHRDIKPENIFLTADGGVKLLDFGVAKTNNAELLDGVDRHETRAGEIFGSPAYMAPEQARNHQVDGRTDIYALGAVLYEALTGTVLFDGASLVETLTQQIVKAPVPPSRRAPDANVPPGVEAVVMRCLAKDPNARYTNAHELAAALERALDDEAAVVVETAAAVAAAAAVADASAIETAPFDSTPDEPSQPLLDDRRGFWMAAAALLLFLFVGGVWYALRPATVRVDGRALEVDSGAGRASASRRGARPRDRDRDRDPDPDATVAALPEVAPPTRPSRVERDVAVANVAPDDVTLVAVADASAPARAPAAVPDVAPRPEPDHYRLAMLAFNAGNYPVAEAQAGMAISDRQGGYNGRSAQVLLGRVLLARGGQHRRAFDVLCTVVNNTPPASQPHGEACRKIRAGSGCGSSDLRATCCDACPEAR